MGSVTQVTASSSSDEEAHMMYAFQLTSYSVLPMTLKAAIELDLLEIIAKAGPNAHLSPSEIAARLPAEKNPQAAVMLDRILRLLAAYDVLTCTVDTSSEGKVERKYGAAPVLKYLTKNEDGVSLDALSLMNQDKILMESWYYLKDAVLDGGIPFNKAHGMTAFEYHGTDPRFNKVFNEGMRNSTIVTKKLLEMYKGFGFSDLKVLVDVGGGVGGTIGTIVKKYPHIKGINFDLPHVISEAPVIPGVEHVGGDMFESVPSGDAIFMKTMAKKGASSSRTGDDQSDEATLAQLMQMLRRGASSGRAEENQPDAPTFAQLMQMQREHNELVMQMQREHNEQLRMAYETTNRVLVVPDPIVLPPRPGNVTDFMKLHPDKFSGTEGPLVAEQWLIRTEQLLIVARIADVDRVDVVRIQLVDLAHIWWQTEAERLGRPIPWAAFSESFLTKFFPNVTKNEMELQFVSLTQGNRTVDEYAAEFARLSRFATSMVANDEDRGRRFLSGLDIDIQDRIAALRLRSYADILDAARIQEQTSSKKRAIQRSVAARSSVGPIRRPVPPLPARASPYPTAAQRPNLVCTFCQKTGHLRRDCRVANRQCLACGGVDHMVRDCPKARPIAPVGGSAPQGALVRGQGGPLPPQR